MPRSFFIRSGRGEANPSQVRPHATVEADGSYHLTTFVTRDGAPVGDFAVTVIWPGPRVKGQGEDEPGRIAFSNATQIRRNRPQASISGRETTELATIDLKPAEEKPRKRQADAEHGR